MGSVWAHVARDKVDDTNTMLLASSAPISASLLAHSPEPGDLAAQSSIEAKQLGLPLPGGQISTDDRAPIEQLVDGSLIAYASGQHPSR
jgi:hypothetical protein